MVHLPENVRPGEDTDLYVIIEEIEGKDLLDESFGIWVDEPDYLEKLRTESEIRIKKLGIV